MILNETYDEVLEKLDDYGLVSEGFFKDSINNSKLLKQAMNNIKDQISSKISECKKCRWYNDQDYVNVIQMSIKLNGKYSESERHQIKSKISSIIDSICREVNPKFKSTAMENWELNYTYRNLLLGADKYIGIKFVYYTNVYN